MDSCDRKFLKIDSESKRDELDDCQQRDAARCGRKQVEGSVRSESGSETVAINQEL